MKYPLTHDEVLNIDHAVNQAIEMLPDTGHDHEDVESIVITYTHIDSNGKTVQHVEKTLNYEEFYTVKSDMYNAQTDIVDKLYPLVERDEYEQTI
jgi:hypothetical protein